MKVKNKETGGLANLIVDKDLLRVKTDAGWADYSSLTDLLNDWEDYEEPKRTWYIDTWGSIRELEAMEIPIGWEEKPILEFETKEEAEKAVEKLKAWKRLKDKGFEFTGWDRHPDFPGDFRITASDEYTCDDKDLDLLFGGEE